jgi:PQQ-dependent dehydrogenase (s-GDH family)
MNMKRLLFALTLLGFVYIGQAQSIKGPMGESFSVRVVADQLSDPWSIILGPDKFIWVTEAKGYRVSRIDPATGKKTVLLDINDQRHFPRYDKMGKASKGKPWPQSGLMGMALHPRLLKGKPYVYLTYIDKFDGVDSDSSGCALNYGGCYFKGKLVRYNYDVNTKKLINPVVLCDSIPQSNDHNGGRLVIAPVNGKDYLFYSIGDMGAGQFVNGGRPNHAQQKNVYEGKILRFNTEPDANTNTFDKWIPDDNPFNGTTQNAVWSLGHRNPQGLVYANVNGVGHLYSSEHGPYSDDEVNLIEKGRNYGHPLIIGYADGNYNGLAAGVSDHDSLPGKWHSTYPLITDEKANAQTIGTTNYRDPLITLYPNSPAFLTDLYAKISSGNEDQQWPSEAPSSIAVYTSNAIPGWKNSILLPTLKGGKLVRLKLDASGDKVTSDTINYFKGKLRYRDIALSADGKKIYLSVDSTQVTSGPSKENPQKNSCRGCIIEYSYEGSTKPGTSKARTVLIRKEEYHQRANAAR